ncbi:SAM-dependent chlorinase/fluorinase [Chloroflexia bacterium SDU3-3]|nr:SAM-dependent chlorinase/fluorinase [Chloroflexia bacterium SDU3-3]
MQPSGIVTLTTDFGSSDSYVGIMKGVILGVNRAAQMVDITHEIRPQNIQQTAYMVQTFYRFFPQGTVHVIVVDPGVGSERQAIALQTPEATFVAPDNGVLTYAYREALARWGAEQVRVHALTEPRFWLPDVSRTFHGRDVFAPVAAHLSRGVGVEQLGPQLAGLHEAQLDEPSVDWRGALVGQIIHVDHFGNYITNICPQHIAQSGLGQKFAIEILDERITKICDTYAEGEVGVLIALFGSSGRLELSVRNGSAAHLLGVGVGDNVKVWPA